MYKNYKTSAFNTVVRIDEDNSIIYNSFSQGLSLLDVNEMGIYKKFDKQEDGNIDAEERDVIDQLLINNFLVPSDINELEKFTAYYRQERQKTDNMGITVLPTLNCNFGCNYCFEGNEKSNTLMPEKIQQSIMNLIQRKSDTIKSLNITWFGGEPLMGLNVIKKLSNNIMPFCDSKGISYYASIITNGYMLTEEVMGELYIRKVRTVQITLDGAEQEHNSTRSLKATGQGTYGRILDNIKAYIDKYPINTIIRINVDKKNVDSIFGLLDDLEKRGLSNTRRLSVYFSPIEASTRACGKAVDEVIKMENFAKHEFELYKYAIAKGLSYNSLPYRMVGICTSCRPNGLVILPNGDLHRCWETVSDESKKIGLLENGDNLTKNLLETKWSDWSPLNYEECRNCPILPNCAGYCSYRFIYGSEFKSAFKTPCPALKYNIKDKLLHYIASKDPDIAKLLLVKGMEGGVS